MRASTWSLSRRWVKCRRVLLNLVGISREPGTDNCLDRRQWLAAGAAFFGIPTLIASVVATWQPGGTILSLLLLAFIPLVLVNFLLVRRGTEVLMMSRMLAAASVMLLLYLNESLSLLSSYPFLQLTWPVLAVFQFGPKEGLAWALSLPAAMFFLGSYGPFADPSLGFALTYFFIAISVAGFDQIRSSLDVALARERGRRLREMWRLHRVREQLFSTQQRLRDFADIASDWFIELDADLRVSEVSTNYEALTGIPIDAMYGISMPDFANGFEDCNVEAHVATLKGHRPFRDFRYALPLGNGDRVYFMTRGAPLFDDKERFRGYLLTGTDTTQHEQYVREISRKDRELDHIQKLGALGQLTSGVAHDFNNLLTVIRGNLEFLKMDNNSDQESVEAIASAVTQASGLTGKLLSFSRRQSPKPELMAVDSFLSELQTLIRHAVGEKVAVVMDVNQSADVMFADPSQLSCAIINLALNARDAMSGEGRLVISARRIEIDQHSLLESGSYVRISVIDEGEGMAPEVVGQVAEPFFTTKEHGQGTGLGLSTAKEFASRSRGTLTIESAVGIGTSVSLYLPVTGAVEDNEDVLSKGVRRQGEGRTVLMVEDETSVQKIVGRMLSVMGYDTIVCDSAEEALEVLKENSPELLLVDMMLGAGMNGLELADKVATSHPDTRVVLMSGYPDDILKRRDNFSDRYEMLRKPFGYDEISSRLEAAFG